MAAGMSNADIGSALVLTVGTVKTHVASILAKTGCRDRLQAVVVRWGATLQDQGPSHACQRQARSLTAASPC